VKDDPDAQAVAEFGVICTLAALWFLVLIWSSQ